MNNYNRDLKPENLLLTENKLLKLIDFGLSNNYNSSNLLLKTPCGSPCYAAPEMLQGKRYNGLMIGIWSTGIILYAMVNGFLPFEDDNNTLLYKKILECKLYFPFLLSDLVLDIMHKILTTNPDKRITLEEIKKHEFYLLGMKTLHKKEIQIDKQRLAGQAIEKMRGLGFSKSDILDNLADNNHNSITATFYLIFNRMKNDQFKKNSFSSIHTVPSKNN
jgi:5'-AMP-activated protein kinase catalytic alpha subunit